ncbi:MAG: hypothetical protein H7A40_07475 [Chlamydiales bacterium]|nr:hypothetical protein [Chlamydiales bacterium]
MAAAIIEITNNTECDWDECRIAFTRQDGSLIERYIFKEIISMGQTFQAKIPNATFEDGDKISYCGLRRNARIITEKPHSVKSLIKIKNICIASYFTL